MEAGLNGGHSRVSQNTNVAQNNLSRLDRLKKETQTIANLQHGVTEYLSKMDASLITKKEAESLLLYKTQFQAMRLAILLNKENEIHDPKNYKNAQDVTSYLKDQNNLSIDQNTTIPLLENIKTTIMEFILSALDTIGLLSRSLSDTEFKQQYEAAFKPIETQIDSIIALLDKKIKTYDTAMKIRNRKIEDIREFARENFSSPASSSNSTLTEEEYKIIIYNGKELTIQQKETFAATILKQTDSENILLKNFDLATATDQQLDKALNAIAQFKFEEIAIYKTCDAKFTEEFGNKTYSKDLDTHKLALESLTSNEKSINDSIHIHSEKNHTKH